MHSSHAPRFVATISLGNVLTIVSVLLGLWGASVRVTHDITSDITARIVGLETKVAPLWEAYQREGSKGR